MPIDNRLSVDVSHALNEPLYGTIKASDVYFLLEYNDSFTNKALRQNFNRLAFVFILGLLMICATLLMIYQPNSTGIKVLFYSTAAILIWTGFKLLFNTKFK